MYPIYVLRVSLSPKFQSVWLYDEPFWLTCHFEKSAPNDLEYYKLKCTPYMSLVSLIPKFHSVFALRPAVYKISGILRQVHQMTQNDLEPTRSNVPHICITISGSQISFRVTLRSAIFKIKAILRQVHRISQIDLEPYKVKLPHMCINGVPDSQISVSP